MKIEIHHLESRWPKNWRETHGEKVLSEAGGYVEFPDDYTPAREVLRPKRRGGVPVKERAPHPVQIGPLGIGEPAPPEHGLGTMIERGLDWTTGGMAKAIAKAIAKVMGKRDCSCPARRDCLNQVVPDVREMNASKWWEVRGRIYGCLGAVEESEESPTTQGKPS